MTEDEMVGWHHRLKGHEFEQALGVGDGQEGLACCGSWGHKESDTAERVNRTELGSPSIRPVSEPSACRGRTPRPASAVAGLGPEGIARSPGPRTLALLTLAL